MVTRVSSPRVRTSRYQRATSTPSSFMTPPTSLGIDPETRTRWRTRITGRSRGPGWGYPSGAHPASGQPPDDGNVPSFKWREAVVGSRQVVEVSKLCTALLNQPAQHAVKIDSPTVSIN